MNNETANSIFTTGPSAPTNLSALTTSDKTAGVPAETPQTKTRPRSQSLAKTKDSKPAANQSSRPK